MLVACTSGAAAITVTDRTIRNWRRRARDGEEISGNAFVGLISKTSLRGNRSRKIDEAVISKMTEIINADYASFGATLSKTLCYGKLLNACEAENLVAPSEKTFRKTVKSLISIEKETHSRQGERAAYKHSPFVYHAYRAEMNGSSAAPTQLPAGSPSRASPTLTPSPPPACPTSHCTACAARSARSANGWKCRAVYRPRSWATSPAP